MYALSFVTLYKMGGEMYISSNLDRKTPYFVYYTQKISAESTNEVIPIFIGLVERNKELKKFENELDTLCHNQINTMIENGNGMWN